jgi:hypothetical protein
MRATNRDKVWADLAAATLTAIGDPALVHRHLFVTS